MNRVFFGCLVLGLAVAACAGDPTAELGGTPAYITTQYALLELAAGDSVSVTAETRDGQGVALSELPTAASQDAAVAIVSDGYLTARTGPVLRQGGRGRRDARHREPAD